MRITKEYLDQITKNIDQKYNTESIDYEDEYDDFLENHLKDLPILTQYFILDQSDTILKYHKYYIETIIEQLYKNILEYIYIPKYRDGSHINNIHTWSIILRDQFRILEDINLGYSFEEYTKNMMYICAYTKAKTEVYFAVQTDIRINNKDYENIDIPEDIPEFIKLENIINGGFAHIFNSYKPSKCNEDELFLP